uniref:Uncharacterized protein n=1 Tax=Romanomermis culicivorax TaxID=13658 RepID=A0A915LAT8_ROMCU
MSRVASNVNIFTLTKAIFIYCAPRSIEIAAMAAPQYYCKNTYSISEKLQNSPMNKMQQINIKLVEKSSD